MAKEYFKNKKADIEVIDGDEYRKFLSPDLGYSKKDRNANIRRLAFVADKLSQYKVIPIISAINPYDEIRKEIAQTYPGTKTVYIKCSLEELMKRDTKGMYARAMLPEGHTNRLNNLSGVNDPFEFPENPDLIIETDKETITESADKLIKFIEQNK